jgi:uncharacterized protein with beta-barrel porin domain
MHRRILAARVKLAVAIVMPFFLATHANGQTTNWTAGTGNWFTPTNWDNGVPAAATNQTNLSNGGTAQISGAATNAGSNLSISGNSTIDVQAGAILTAGTVNISAGSKILLNTSLGNFADVSNLLGSGQINGNGGFLNDLSVSQGSFAGQIGGFLDLQKRGLGTLTLSGVNTYAFTEIISGTLEIGNINALGSGNIIIESGVLRALISGTLNNTIELGAQLSAAPGQTLTLANTVSVGSNSFGRFGSPTDTGTIVLGPNVSAGFNARFVIGGGTVVLNTAIPNDPTFVIDPAGKLTGSGTIGPTTVFGMLAPTVLLTVNGPLTLNGGAFYQVTLTPGGASATAVNGIAALGGVLQLVPQGNGFTFGQQFNILRGGGLTGTFASTQTVGSFGSNLRGVASYTPNDVVVSLVHDQLAPVLPSGSSDNQRNVAQAVDRGTSGTTTVPTGFTVLQGLTGSALSDALTQVSGQPATGASTSGTQLMNSFLSLTLNPFGGAPGGNSGTLGFARGFGAGEHELSPEVAAAYAAVTPRDARMDTLAKHWGFWGQGYGGYNKTNGDTNTGAADSIARSYGFAVGADYRVLPEAMLGFALAGAGTGWGLSQALGGGHGDVFQFGVYGSKQFGAAYVAAAVSYAHHWVTTDRTVTIAGTEQLRADFGADSYGGRLEGGYHFVTPIVGVTPYAAVQVQQFHTPAYSERAISGAGAFALAYDARTTTATRIELGSWLDKVITLDRGNTIALRTRAAWAHDHSNNQSLGAAFQTLPASNFIVNGAAPPTDLALFSEGVEYRLANGISIGAKLDGEFGVGSQTYAGTGTVRYIW